jgi:hypothetical protein
MLEITMIISACVLCGSMAMAGLTGVLLVVKMACDAVKNRDRH